MLFWIQDGFMALLNYINYVSDKKIAELMESAYTHFMEGRKKEGESAILDAVEFGKESDQKILPCAIMKMVYDDVLIDLQNEIVLLSSSMPGTTLRPPAKDEITKYHDLAVKARLLGEYAESFYGKCVHSVECGE